jgi:hypothetical protein
VWRQIIAQSHGGAESMEEFHAMGRRSGTVGTALVPLVAVLALGATACAGRREPASAPRGAGQPEPSLIRAIEPPAAPVPARPEPSSGAGVDAAGGAGSGEASVAPTAPPGAPVETVGIAAARGAAAPDEPVVEPPPAQAPPAGTDPAVEQPAEAASAAAGPGEGLPSSAAATPANEERPSLRELCRKPEGNGFVDESRRRLEETFCGATLWFDGLFGGEPDLRNARAVSGRVELSTLHTDFDGTEYKGRLRLNYELPTLERRVRFFLGREDEDDFITDREEGFAIRSSVFGLENV